MNKMLKKTFAILLAVSLAFLCTACNTKNKSNSDASTETTASDTAKTTTSVQSTSTVTAAADADTVAGKARLFVDKSSYTALKTDKASMSLPYKIKDAPLTVTEIKKYSGPDLSTVAAKTLKNATAIVVKNNSKNKNIEFAQLTMKAGKTKLVFEISTLPAGKEILVVEKNAAKLDDGCKIVYDATLCTYLASMNMYSDVFKITAQGSGIKIENKTSNDYSAVDVYYKYVDANGRFFGGTTYKARFTNLAAAETATTVTTHLDADNCKLIMVKYTE